MNFLLKLLPRLGSLWPFNRASLLMLVSALCVGIWALLMLSEALAFLTAFAAAFHHAPAGVQLDVRPILGIALISAGVIMTLCAWRGWPLVAMPVFAAAGCGVALWVLPYVDQVHDKGYGWLELTQGRQAVCVSVIACIGGLHAVFLGRSRSGWLRGLAFVESIVIYAALAIYQHTALLFTHCLCVAWEPQHYMGETTSFVIAFAIAAFAAYMALPKPKAVGTPVTLPDG
jgi:hypothetical protein